MNFKKQQTVAAGKANQTSYVGMFKKKKKEEERNRVMALNSFL